MKTPEAERLERVASAGVSHLRKDGTLAEAEVWGTMVHPEATFTNASKGGIEVWIRDFLKYSTKRYRLVGEDRREDIPPSVLNRVTATQIFRSSEKFRLLPKSLRFALRLWPKRRLLEGVLIVHRVDLVWALKLLQPKAKILLIVHTDLLAQKEIGERLWRFIPKWIYFSYEKWAFSVVDLVVSQASSDFARVKALATKSHLVRGWYDHNIFFAGTTQIREELVLWVGRLEHTKNPLLALHSFAQSELVDRFKLVFIGAGRLRETIVKEIARLGLSDRVELLGVVDQQQLAGYLRRAKILIHTSLFEATPKIFLEAFGCGTNVVAHERNDPEALCLLGSQGLRAQEYSSRGFSAALNQSAECFSNSVPTVSLDSRRASQVVPGLEGMWSAHFEAPSSE